MSCFVISKYSMEPLPTSGMPSWRVASTAFGAEAGLIEGVGHGEVSGLFPGGPDLVSHLHLDGIAHAHDPVCRTERRAEFPAGEAP